MISNESIQVSTESASDWSKLLIAIVSIIINLGLPVAASIGSFLAFSGLFPSPAELIISGLYC